MHFARNLQISQLAASLSSSGLACCARRILGGRKLLVYVRIAVAAIFDFMTEED